MDGLKAGLKQAMLLYGSKNTAGAEALCRDLLARYPENPEVLGALAIMALQSNRREKAIDILRRSLAQTSPAAVLRRNLDNLVTALVAEGWHQEAARILARTRVPAWDGEAPPRRNAIAIILSLSRHLGAFRLYRRALALLESVEPFATADPTITRMLGVLRSRTGDREGAEATLQRASGTAPADPTLMAAAAGAATDIGAEDLARQEAAQFIAAAPMLLTPKQPGQRILFGVPNFLGTRIPPFTTPEALHFSGNFTGQLYQRYQHRYQFLSVFVQSPQAMKALAKSPAPDVVFNVVITAELLLSAGVAGRLAAFSRIWGVPAINDPAHAIRVTRDASEALYAGIPGLIVPKVRRLSKEGDLAVLAARIEEDFRYPMIIRGTFEQKGLNAYKVDDRAELDQALASVEADPHFYAIQFVDSGATGGLRRKIRAAVVGEHLQVMRVDFDTSWNVHGRQSAERQTFYRNNPQLLEEERRITSDPDGYFGFSVMGILRAIRARMPLDLFGVDFDVAADGRLIFYEANAAMNLLATKTPGVQPPKEPEAEFMQAFDRFVLRLKDAGRPKPSPNA